jgi:ubiquinone/menaquinone biosynthesis C-methylase UbiE
MAKHLCPPLLGYLLLTPLRRLVEDPKKMLGPYIREGMMVLEPGPGMGYFTLPLARMVGPTGRVIALDIQTKMLSVLKKRATKAGLSDRIELRQIEPASMGIEDLSGKVDFAVAIHMVHELADQDAFFKSVFEALKPGGKLFFAEPKGHVSPNRFSQSVDIAKRAGFVPQTFFHGVRASETRVLLVKPAQKI